MKNRDWFKVSTEGLRQLQAGKPKHFILRELVQNAWDEDTKVCKVMVLENVKGGLTEITVEDDNPEGFKDLADSFTLFKPTDKRLDPTKRGRFNLGEKQALSMCEYAKIETTKGTMSFSSEGRKQTGKTTTSGSRITIALRLKPEEVKEIHEVLSSYLCPKGIKFSVPR